MKTQKTNRIRKLAVSIIFLFVVMFGSMGFAHVSGQILADIPSPDAYPQGLAWDGSYLWNSNIWDSSGNRSAMIYKINPSNGDVISSFAAPGPEPKGLAWDGTYLWNADMETNMLYQLDPLNGNVISSFPSPSENPRGLAWDGISLWVAVRETNMLYLYFPVSDR